MVITRDRPQSVVPMVTLTRQMTENKTEELMKKNTRRMAENKTEEFMLSVNKYLIELKSTGGHEGGFGKYEVYLTKSKEDPEEYSINFRKMPEPKEEPHGEELAPQHA